eukprot:m.220984 g.220984  ORF g.220984 m.220984 type:complete len:202 (+) comp15123_c0_seq2:237-842(+)
MAHAQGVPSAVPSGVPRFSVEVSWPVAISTWVHRNRFWLVRVQNVLDVRHNSPAFFGAVAAWAIVLSILQWVSIPLVPLGCCLGIVYVIVAHRMLQRNDQDRNLETPLTSQQRETLAMFKDELLAWHRYLSTAVDTAVNSQYASAVRFLSCCALFLISNYISTFMVLFFIGVYVMLLFTQATVLDVLRGLRRLITPKSSAI